MNVPITTRLWLAWQVLRGVIVSAQWDSQGMTTVAFENTKQFNQKFRRTR